MAGTSGVAEREGTLPGTVLAPNTNEDLSPDPMAQFGTELQKPDAAPADDPNAKRFEYWQSEAQKAQAKAQALEAELAQRKPMDPLVDLIKSDEVSYRFLQDRLKGNTQVEKPLEPPQKPDSYNEVEAYSNPESSSFKYRKELENYKDRVLLSTQSQLQALHQQQAAERQRMEQEHARQEGLRKFRSEIVNQGLADEDFAEFFEFINGGAKPDELVKSFYSIRKGQSAPSVNRAFGVIPPSSVGGRPQKEQVNFGEELIRESRRM